MNRVPDDLELQQVRYNRIEGLWSELSQSERWTIAWGVMWRSWILSVGIWLALAIFVAVLAAGFAGGS